MALGLQARLTRLNIALLLAVLVPVGAIGYRHESRAMNELLDRNLEQSGRTIAALVLREPPASPAAPGSRPRPIVAMRHADGDPGIGYQAYDATGREIAVTSHFAAFPRPVDGDLGFALKIIDGVHWRMFTLRTESGGLVRIGEQYDTRRAILRAQVLEHGLPLVIALPLLALLLGVSVRRSLRPLRDLTALLRARAPGSRRPVVLPEVTEDLRPLVDTLNAQFERLEEALERERRFSADVAHELRTPLASAMILIDSVPVARFDDAADADLRSARASLAHLARRIEQVLSLARLERGAAVATRGPCDVGALLRDVIEELGHQISDKRIGIGLLCEARDAVVVGHAASLSAMFRNVVENAFRYVDVGGNVAVSISATADMVQVDVQDDGPGIAPDRREAVFARFRRDAETRADGYGLGLGIVREAARRHGATVVLSDVPVGTGLKVSIRLPRVPAPFPPLTATS